MVRHWLMKSEPSVYSIRDLERDGSTHWDGIRNYQARNFMRDDMSVGDEVLFYHSNAKPPAVVGVARVCKEAYPDHTARDPDSAYYDERATDEDPRWFMVDIEFVERLPRPVPLAEIKADDRFEDMVLVNRSRLSIQPVDEAHFRALVELGHAQEATV